MEDMVKAFHIKHNYPIGLDLQNQEDASVGMGLKVLAEVVKSQANTLGLMAAEYSRRGDERCYRAWLIMEEASEVLFALSEKDEVELADGLADLLYVVTGTAITFNIPLKKVAEEVHRSNMTKKIRDKKTNYRMRDKGKRYSPPNIRNIIKENRHVDN